MQSQVYDIMKIICLLDVFSVYRKFCGIRVSFFLNMEKCLEAYSEHSGISKMELLAKFINSFNSLTTFVKSSILEV